MSQPVLARRKRSPLRMLARGFVHWLPAQGTEKHLLGGSLLGLRVKPGQRLQQRWRDPVLVSLPGRSNQRILTAWNTRQEENQQRAARGLPPKTRKRRRKTLAALAAPP